MNEVPNIEPDDCEPDEELDAILRETMLKPVPASTSDLDAILAEAVQAQRAEQEFKNRKKMLAKLPAVEREAAMKEWARIAEAKQWQAHMNVALFHSQHCISCTRDHAFFHGWFTEHKHKTDPHARKLSLGKAIERLPERIEIQFKGNCELCIDCAGAHIGVENMLQRLDAKLELASDYPQSEAA